MPLPKGKVAFVTGANGISGNALVEHLIRQPQHEWSKIVITSRTSLKAYWQDPRVHFIAIDFLQSLPSIIEKIQYLCADVTHAYFTSYIHNTNNDFDNLWQKNVPLFKNFLNAIDHVAADSLQRVCLQTGGKHYGVHQGAMHAPMSEERTLRWDDGTNFYFDQEDFMFDLQSKRKWGYNIIRPQAIIGFTPGPSGMTAALKLVQYLIICRETGESPQFPGNELFYNSVDDCSYAPSLADLSVWATTQDYAKNEAFNHANGDVFSWRWFLPRLGDYLGVKVPDNMEFKTKGVQGGVALEYQMGEWAKDKKPIWDKICQKYGGTPEAFDWGAWTYFDWASSRNWLALTSVNKAREYGWQRHDDTFETWVKTIRAFENSGILPEQIRWEALSLMPEKV